MKNNTTIQYYLKAALLSVCSVGALLFFHLYRGATSMLNYAIKTSDSLWIAEDYLKGVVDYHKTLFAFAKRPFTTFFIDKLSDIVGFTIGESFIVVNFFFLLLCGIVLFHLSRYVLNNVFQAYLSEMAFFLSFTILFAFFPSIYTYDEPLQYLLIFLGLSVFVQKKFFKYIVLFAVSLMVRENGILLIPGLLFLVDFPFLQPNRFFSKKNIKAVILTILPVLLYLGYLYTVISNYKFENQFKQDLLNRPFYFSYNFQNIQFAIETFISLLLATGVHLYLLIIYWIYHPVTKEEKRWVYAFISTFILNTLVVLYAAKAREARLFALPLIFVWPIMGKIIYQEGRFLVEHFRKVSLGKKFWTVMTGLFLCSFLIYRYVYKPTAWSRGETLQDEYLLLMLAGISLHWSVRHCGFIINVPGVNRNAGR